MSENGDFGNDDRQQISKQETVIAQQAQQTPNDLEGSEIGNSALGNTYIPGTGIEFAGAKVTTETSTKTTTKIDPVTGETVTETKGKTTAKTSTPTGNPQIDELVANIDKVNNIVTSLNIARNSAVELTTNFEELTYYNRMVRPLVDTLYFLALTTQGVALSTQGLNNINNAKPKQVDLGVDIAYELLKEVEIVLSVLRKRLDCYLELVETNNDNC